MTYYFDQQLFTNEFVAVLIRETYQTALQAQQHAFKVLVHQDHLAPALEFVDSFGALQVPPMLYLSTRVRHCCHSQQCTWCHAIRLLSSQVGAAEVSQHVLVGSSYRASLRSSQSGLAFWLSTPCQV